jgi:hypothetical protein
MCRPNLPGLVQIDLFCAARQRPARQNQACIAAAMRARAVARPRSLSVIRPRARRSAGSPTRRAGRSRRPSRLVAFLPDRLALLLRAGAQRKQNGRLDAHALAVAVGDWLVARDSRDHRVAVQRPRQGGDHRRQDAARRPPNRRPQPPVHLLAAMDRTSRVVLAASGVLAVAAGNPACPGPGDRRALEVGFAACLPGAAWMTPE